MLPAVQQPHMLDFISHSPAQTERIGQRLGEQLQAGDLILLHGPFGAGKTHLVKGVARGLGSNDLVTSPSFVLVNEYRSGTDRRALTIYHIDLYRLDSTAELKGIGIEELWEGPGICIIEWAERATELPATNLAIYIQHLSETKRILRFVPRGIRYRRLLEDFKGAAFG